MKKLIFAFTVSLLSLSLNAQIKVIEQPTLIGSANLPGISTPFAKLESTNNVYAISYRDRQYTHITDYKYFIINTNETLQGLYDILIKQLKAPKKTELMIDIDGTNITIVTNKILGRPYLTLYVKAKGQPMGTFNLEPKYVNKLFGK